MGFILLSIASFILRTLPIFEVSHYDFLIVYTSHNSTEKTFVTNHEQRELISRNGKKESNNTLEK